MSSGRKFRRGQGQFVAIVGPSGSGKSPDAHRQEHRRGFRRHLPSRRRRRVAAPADELACASAKIGFVFQAFHPCCRAPRAAQRTLPLVYAEVAREGANGGQGRRSSPPASMKAAISTSPTSSPADRCSASPSPGRS